MYLAGLTKSFQIFANFYDTGTGNCQCCGTRAVGTVIIALTETEP